MQMDEILSALISVSDAGFESVTIEFETLNVIQT